MLSMVVKITHPADSGYLAGVWAFMRGCHHYGCGAVGFSVSSDEFPPINDKKFSVPGHAGDGYETRLHLTTSRPLLNCPPNFVAFSPRLTRLRPCPGSGGQIVLPQKFRRK